MSKTSQNVKENFMSSMSGKVAAGALAFTAAFLPMTGKLGTTFDATANAQDRAVTTTHAPSAHTPGAIDTSKPWTRKAAFQASEGRIVLHYGEGIKEITIDTTVMALTQSGYPAIAVPGGPKGAVELFIGEKIIGKYNQDQLYNAVLGSDAIEFYNVIIKKMPDPNLVSLAR